MAYTLTSLPPLPFDTVIDVRAPSEFAEDHMPGAINLPVLSDAERARVGTIYVRQDRFLARKIGAALVARNAAVHIEGPLADKEGGWRPLVYCWRGGQRSGSFASILSQIGWRVEVVEGGYRSYRRLVSRLLYDTPLPHRLVLVDGGTGTGKTQLLQRMARDGAQVIDLEGLARHRGSNFGGWDGGQPAQKMFESHLAQVVTGLDPARPVFVEAESSSIGRVKLPPALWQAMGTAPVVRIEVPLSARARFLTTTYPDLTADAALLERRIESLKPYHPGDRIAAWHRLAHEGRYETLAEGLIEAHYDPRYRRPGGAERVELGTVAVPELTEAEIARAAERVMALGEAKG
ncbi:tRNA 2-selenouridine(34) synthase MnmH [Jannaschia formosa]|uniref:tRNA 2-selenouridine(34) synthase MnmH n=1 Tax=Jannaschia formosa TaxID=2259592 RepID=UPI000E1C2E93|nr:tRNA 2-selenouridine(34) synthase MnmH [Jannaschia formosa]TFL18658.1 tRNA 2-selenouridine(34) synthase MnmH [Jannaschia formosa]